MPLFTWRTSSKAFLVRPRRAGEAGEHTPKVRTTQAVHLQELGGLSLGEDGTGTEGSLSSSLPVLPHISAGLEESKNSGNLKKACLTR